MGDIVKLKTKKAKSEREGEVLFFLRQLDLLKQLYVSGTIDKIVIIANGEGVKCCTGNKINISTSKQLCSDFINNVKEYID